MTALNQRKPPNHLVRIVLFLTLLLICTPLLGQNRSPSSTIDPFDLYAAFLTKFPHFVTWPNKGEREKEPAIRLGIIGKNVFRKKAINSINAQSYKGRPFKVIEIARPAEIGELDMLFVGESEDEHIEKIIQATKDKGILTIAAIPQFAQRGGMINIKPREGFTQFEVNLEQVKAEKLRISAKLLRAAIIVE